MPWLFDFYRLITTQIYCCNNSLSSAFIALHPLDLHIYIYSNRHLNLWVSWQSNLIFIIYMFYCNSNVSFPVNYQVVFTECSNTTQHYFSEKAARILPLPPNVTKHTWCEEVIHKFSRQHQFAASGGGRGQKWNPTKMVHCHQCVKYWTIYDKYFSDPYIIDSIILIKAE